MKSIDFVGPDGNESRLVVARRFSPFLSHSGFVLVIIWCFTIMPASAKGGLLFASDYTTGSVYEFSSNGSQSTFASGLINPEGLAFNSQGDLFVADTLAGNIYEFTPGGTRSTFATGLPGPFSLAFNAAGNLFVGDYQSDDIYEFTPSGIMSTFINGGQGPAALAFNSSGDLFVSDGNGSDIYEFTPAGVRSVFATGLANPTGLAFATSGDLFAADNNGNIFEFKATGQRSTFASGVNIPSGLASDSNGDIFAAALAVPGNIFEFTSTGQRSTVATNLGHATFLVYEVPEPSGLLLFAIGGIVFTGSTLQTLKTTRSSGNANEARPFSLEPPPDCRSKSGSALRRTLLGAMQRKAGEHRQPSYRQSYGQVSSHETVAGRRSDPFRALGATGDELRHYDFRLRIRNPRQDR